MSHRLSSALVVLALATGVVQADQPVADKLLRLQKSLTGETLKLALKDPTVPVPMIGGPDDPSIVGFTLTLVRSSAPEIVTLSVPPGLGNPGWSVRSGSSASYTYRNGGAPAGPSPIKMIRLRQGKGLKILARTAGLQLTAPQGSVGVRIEMGSTRTCALFADAAVRKDELGRFLARDAAAPGLGECSD